MANESQQKLDVLQEYDELPPLVYFEANEGPDAYFVARGYGDTCVEHLIHEEVAYAIRDRLDILPHMAAEIKRLRVLEDAVRALPEPERTHTLRRIGLSI